VFGIGGNELLIIAVFVIIIFGPDKIPEIARTVGKAVRMFKKVQEDVEHVIKTEIYTPDILGTSTEKPAQVAPVTPPVDNVSSASAIWAAAGEDDDEEGEEE